VGVDILHAERIGPAFDFSQFFHQRTCFVSVAGPSSARPNVAAMAALASAPSVSNQNIFFMRPPLPYYPTVRAHRSGGPLLPPPPPWPARRDACAIPVPAAP